MTTRNPGCMRRAARRKGKALSAALLLTAFGCTPQPSSKPLGWGPLSPGMRGEESPPPHHSSNKVAHAAPPPRTATAADAGTSHAAVAAVAIGGDGQKTPSAAPIRTGDPKTKPTAAQFVGDYLGEDVATYHIESLPDRTETDPKARLKVTTSSDTSLDFELVDSSNGKEICTLKGTLSAAKGATIAKGQKCFEQNGEEASAAATVQSGTASVDQSRLVFDLDMTFAMEIAGRKLGGTLVYHFDGKRK